MRFWSETSVIWGAIDNLFSLVVITLRHFSKDIFPAELLFDLQPN